LIYFIISFIFEGKKMTAQIHREVTPLTNNDCFLVFDRQRIGFNFPIHFHPEFEINYIRNAAGAKRVVGDHIREIADRELVIVGPNLYHGWENFKNSKTDPLHEITIQFPIDLLTDTCPKPEKRFRQLPGISKHTL
jgi:hypothetical protein